MDYKNTVNLPKTGFSMKADLVTREPERLERWHASGLYSQIQQARASAPKFVLHDGPPFANGDVHIGTALNKILKDTVIRFKSIRGFNAPYVPGWDCHGLPIEFKVTQEMRKSGQPQADAASIRQACSDYARKYIDLQRVQFQRLGILGEWENPYLTFDRGYEASELRLFADIVEKGFVYRGKKPVYWSIPCRTALAEAEVEYQDHISQSTYVKFPLAEHPGTFLLIWTTTPWTLPANLAVAYNSSFTYSMARVGGEIYILSTLLLSKVAETCGWDGYEIIRTVHPEEFAQLEYRHPFIPRTGRLYPGDAFVENSTGTGFVHIAPGHGLEDYALGREHGLPIYSPVDDDGRFTHTGDLPADQQMPVELLGKSILEKNNRSEANDAVLERLRSTETLVFQENYTHSYPHCWRSKTPVIFRAMDQWFIAIDHDGFRDRALEAIQGVEWIPDWGKNRIEAAVKSRPDWCISRQRTWGLPIPAFYFEDGQAVLDPEVVRNTATLIEKHGSNIWFELPVAELWDRVKPSAWTQPAPSRKSLDTLDVWIDSGSSSRAVLAQRSELAPDSSERKPWQADLYLEGSDQHRGWFQSSLLLSLAGNGAAPYRAVLTHGFLVDADREKISKSKTGYEKPQTADAYVNKYGADILRLWVASQDYRNDIIVSEERISKVAETYRLLRNTLRYQLSNLFDFIPGEHAVPFESMTALDLWILGEFAELEHQVFAAFECFEFHVVYQKVSQFVAVQLSAVYHDLVKDRLYTDLPHSARRRSTQSALHCMVQHLCQMLAPVLVFTSDEAWERIRGVEQPSVHLTTWEPLPKREPGSWAQLLPLREQVLAPLEKARQSKQIGKALEAQVLLRGNPEDPWIAAALAHPDDLRELLNVSQLRIEPAPGAPLEIIVEKASGQKCERCWHWEATIGSDIAHPALCARCADAVAHWPEPPPSSSVAFV